MNLLHLHRTKDPVLSLGDGVALTRRTISGRTFDGFILPGRPDGEVRLAGALRWHPFSSRPATTDWLAIADGWSLVDLEVALVKQDGETVSRVVDQIGRGACAVSLPRLRRPTTMEADHSLDLVLRNRGGRRSRISLLVVELDSPKSLLAQATGRGVELLNEDGPLLKPTPELDLFYVGSEAQLAAARKASPRPSGVAWCEELVGDRHDIPLVDGSLDFILADKILHRAVNPLGHLERWRAKLRAGGRILGTVPYVAGGSDYVNAPTPMAEWLEQYRTGGFEETQAHHNAFARARGLNPKSLFRRRHPSAFSFFTPSNVADMLGFAVEHLGYVGMHLEHARNGQAIRFGLYA